MQTRALFFTRQNQISGDSELHQITDEYALYYLDKEYNPKGLVVEYYGANFIKHHPELEMMDIFDPKSNIDIVIDPHKLDDPKVIACRSAFENAIISEGIKEPLVDTEPVA